MPISKEANINDGLIAFYHPIRARQSIAHIGEANRFQCPGSTFIADCTYDGSTPVRRQHL